MSDAPVGGQGSSYVCPVTRAPLMYRDGVLRAVDHDREYEVCDGIPNFLAFPPVETEWNEPAFKALTARARRIGWQPAFQEHCEKSWGRDSRNYRYATDPSRSSFLDLLELDRAHTVLEIGTNVGQVTVPLAQRVKNVHGIDIVPAFLRFTASRCALEGVTNVKLACGGDNCLLPFEEKRFDFVILNLVFEWIGARNKATSLLESQRRILREVHRVLRPAGTLYLSTKNRYALGLLLGGRDVHAHGQRFGGAMPRWLLAGLFRAKRLPRAEGLLHSYHGLKKALEHAGFAQVLHYVPIPDPQFPSTYIPVNRQAISAVQARSDVKMADDPFQDHLLRRMPASVLPVFGNGLVFTATRPEQSVGARRPQIGPR